MFSGRVLGLAAVLAVVAVVHGAYNWQPVVWGGGGYITGLMFHPKVEGLMFARTDVGGAYRRDPGSRTWIPMVNTISRDDADLYSVLSMAVDPQKADNVYLATGMYTADWGRNAAIMRSADRGKTWSRTELSFKLGGNENGRGSGERLQVDPNLCSVLYLGTTNNGLWRSTDSGVTWSKVSSCYASGITFVLFDAQSGKSGAATPHIYVGVAGINPVPLLHSTDGGATWSAVRGQPWQGQFPLSAAPDGAGRVYFAYSNALGPNGAKNGSVHVYDYNGGGTWTDITPEKPNWYGYGGISVSAQSPSVIAVTSLDRWYKGDTVWRSLNGGRHWTEMKDLSTLSAPGNPWQRLDGMGHWMTDIEIDPFSENHVLYTTGLGLYETDDFLCSSCPWFFNVRGIEEICVTSLAAPPSGDAMLFVTAGDVDGGRYGSNYTDLVPFPELVSAYGIDYAQYWPKFVARTASNDMKASLSWDGGLTWQAVPAQPAVDSKTNPGRIAVAANGASMVWSLPGYGAWYSTDNGKRWTAANGYPASVDNRYFMPVADRVQGGVFYTYDYGKGQLLESTDSGKTFTAIYSSLDTMPYYASRHQLVSLPTQQRDLWLATPNGLYHVPSKSAKAPVKIAGVSQAYGISYGAAASGKSYPTLYLSGKVNGVVGLYQSVDVANSWTRIDDDNHRWLVDHIVGDPRVYGRVFVAPGGRGVLAGTPA